MAEALGAEFKSSGVTEKTPGNIPFGAGTIHKGLTFDSAGTKKWNFAESLVGATSGGSKFEIVPEVAQVEVDGALVAVAELDVKQGETANMEINFVELTPDIIKASVIGKSAESDIEGYSVITSKPNIEKGDYWDNIAFVGKTLTGKPIIVIMENALCTSGLSIEGSAVQGVSEKVPTMIEWFNKYKGVVVAVTAVVSVLTAAVGVHSAVQAVKSAMNTAEATSLGVLIAAKWADVTATAAMLAPYIAIIGAIAALAAGVIYCYNHFETFRNIVNGVAEWIKSNLAAAFEFLKPYIEAIISAVGELVSAIGDRLMQAFQWIVDKITEVYNSSSPIVQAIKTLFITHFENIKVYITTVFNVIKTVVSTVMTVIKQIIQTITAAIKGDWSGVWNGIKAIFSTIWDAIKSIVSTVLNAIKTIISNTLNTVKGIISNVKLF